jgi:uncharacterized membrane protein
MGASWFPDAPSLATGRAFYNSAADFRDYLLSSQGLGVPVDNLCWLFDDSRSPSDQLMAMASFLSRKGRELSGIGTPPEELFFFYVGHGMFTQADQSYCLAVRATDENNQDVTSVRASDLAAVIKGNARFLRRFFILDCCFAASAFRHFQSSPLQVAKVQLLEELPSQGTALLCSSSASDPSLVSKDFSRTMFTGALLIALKHGHPNLGDHISFSELGDLVKQVLRKEHPQDWVRPQVLSPDQREGDISRVPLFPNPASSQLRGRREAGRVAQVRPGAEKADLARREEERTERARREARKVERARREPEQLSPIEVEHVELRKPNPQPLRQARQKAVQTVGGSVDLAAAASDCQDPVVLNAPESVNSPGVARLMVILAYLWPLAMIPFALEKKDPEVRWHARNGIALFLSEVALWAAFLLGHFLLILSRSLAPFSRLFSIIQLFFFFCVCVFVVHGLCIINGLRGRRFRIYRISEIADRWSNGDSFAKDNRVSAPQNSRAATAYLLGLLGVLTGVFGPPAWYIGYRELRAIRQGQRVGNDGLAKAGMVFGIVGTVFLVLELLWIFFWGGMAVLQGR